ncbi:metal-binding protein [Salinivirga cyanobacteriivorans]|uniref:GTP cyclohydrolase 1 type 2 homolog n=1 Tax=Salinivirga cyanobacteriivorans TaxID=1307839 RepID=A0A0S2HVY3_9BACT|nr:Nif3-like dinuclear metal center hexameric protein [Salinivirga cyanobacteriivorans]ALO14194.1 metal-binding protein [Salinivirga cyanobacteriivorans]
MQINELIGFLNKLYPPQFQESYDNSGLLISRDNNEISKALLTLDITPEVMDEAIEVNADLIIAHHPVIFKPLKKIHHKSPVEKIIRKALAHDIAIYSAHTNMDSARGGTNDKLCELLNLKNCEVLSPIKDYLYKLVVFVPEAQANDVRQAIFDAGAGTIGEYDSCSYNLEGKGSFRAGDNTDPYVGEKGKLHFEAETRVETIVPKHLLQQSIDNMKAAHPYEEVAYDVYPLANNFEAAGLGRIGVLENPMSQEEFLKLVKAQLGADHLRFSGTAKKISKVALCSGSGSSLARAAASQKADAYISADFKYHEFQDAAEHLLVIDAGHYDTEKFVKDIFYQHITEKFPKFALYLSKVNTNPINLY